jgi:hypothetical protein
MGRNVLTVLKGFSEHAFQQCFQVCRDIGMCVWSQKTYTMMVATINKGKQQYIFSCRIGLFFITPLVFTHKKESNRRRMKTIT